MATGVWLYVMKGGHHRGYDAGAVIGIANPDTYNTLAEPPPLSPREKEFAALVFVEGASAEDVVPLLGKTFKLDIDSLAADALGLGVRTPSPSKRNKKAGSPSDFGQKLPTTLAGTNGGTAVQLIARRKDDASIETLQLPAPSTPLLGGLRWGHGSVLHTPAYWAAQYWFFAAKFNPACLRLGKDLRTETAACLLGTAGVPSEVALGAFNALRESGVFCDGQIPLQRVRQILQTPIALNGRMVKYRFAERKAQFLSQLPTQAEFEGTDKLSDVDLRAWLMGLPGIGPKVGSWIVRNHRFSTKVAVLDIHIRRAGLTTGFFAGLDPFHASYSTLESRYLEFASAIGAHPATLDCLIWLRMRSSNVGALLTRSALAQAA